MSTTKELWIHDPEQQQKFADSVYSYVIHEARCTADEATLEAILNEVVRLADSRTNTNAIEVGGFNFDYFGNDDFDKLGQLFRKTLQNIAQEEISATLEAIANFNRTSKGLFD